MATGNLGPMVGWIIVGALVVLSILALLYAESYKPRGRDRGGFEVHPGLDR